MSVARPIEEVFLEILPVPPSKYYVYFQFWISYINYMTSALNVLGKQLAYFGGSPIRSGFFRDGYCRTSPQDHGAHAVAGIVSSQFLDFSGFVNFLLYFGHQ